MNCATICPQLFALTATSANGRKKLRSLSKRMAQTWHGEQRFRNLSLKAQVAILDRLVQDPQLSQASANYQPQPTTNAWSTC